MPFNNMCLSLWRMGKVMLIDSVMFFLVYAFLVVCMVTFMGMFLLYLIGRK